MELKGNSKIKVGNQTSFWKDNGHEVPNLEIFFSDIFNIVPHHQRTIAEMGTSQGFSIISEDKSMTGNYKEWLISLLGYRQVNTYCGGKATTGVYSRSTQLTE